MVDELKREFERRFGRVAECEGGHVPHRRSSQAEGRSVEMKGRPSGYEGCRAEGTAREVLREKTLPMTVGAVVLVWCETEADRRRSTSRPGGAGEEKARGASPRGRGPGSRTGARERWRRRVRCT